MTAQVAQPSADDTTPAVYDAFLSYTHRDRLVATGIQRGLHQVGRRLGALRALRVFRDDTNLEVSPDLWGTITKAMDRARYLVVVVSPNAAQSYWVNREVQYWLDHNPRDRLLVVVAGGRLDWDPTARCFDPVTSDAALPVLTQPGVLGAQPLTVDVSDDAPWDPRSASLRDKVTTLAAPVHGQTPEELAGVDRREQRRLRRVRAAAVAALAVLTVTAVVLAIVAFIQDGRAITQRNRAIAARLNAEASAMLVKDEPGGDQRAMQQVLAARLISTPDDGVLLGVLAQRATTAKIIGAGAPVFGVAISPTGRLIATADKDRTVRLFDADTGTPVGNPLRGHTDEVGAVAFSPDGRILASAGGDRTIRLWDTTSWRLIGSPLTGHTGAVGSIVFSPDGDHLASASTDGTIGLWDARTGARTGVVPTGNEPTLWQVAFSPDGHRIAYPGGDHSVHLWSLDTNNEIGKPLHGSDFPLSGVAFSPDGHRVAGASDRVYVWDSDSGEPVNELGGYSGMAMSVAFSPDGGRIAAAGTDGGIRLWSASTGKPVSTPLLGHTDAVRQVAFGRDGARLVSAGLDGAIRVWSLARILSQGDAEGVPHIAFDPAGHRVAAAKGNGTVVIFDSASGQVIRVLPGHSGIVWSAAFSPDGRRLASAGADGTVRLWNADTGQPAVPPLTGHTGAVRAVAYSADGHRLASGGEDGTVRLWNADTGQPLVAPLKGHDKDVRAVAFGPHGKLLISAGNDGTVRLWDAHTGEPQNTLQGSVNNIDSVAFSPDGLRFAYTTGNDIRLISMSDGKPIGTLSGHTDTVTAVAFSPDGHRLTSASLDQTVRLWDADSRRPIGDAFTGHADRVYSVGYSPDGQTVVSSGADGTVRLWDVVAQPDRLCDKLTADITKDQWREWIGDQIPYKSVCPKLPAGGPAPPPAAFTALGISRLNHPQAVAVNRAGDLFVADMKNNRVLKVVTATGAATPLPFGGIHEPTAVAVDDAGDVFVGTGDNKAYKLPSGASKAVQLPLPDLRSLGDIATDGPGNLYVGDGNRILKLTARSDHPQVLLLDQDARIGGLAVDRRGDIFVSDQQDDHVMELPVGSTQPTVLPFYGLRTPGGLTVDASGNLFVADTDNNRVLEFPSGWHSDRELPFDGLKEPYAVAVGSAGDLYVADAGNNRVLKLPAAAR